MYRRMYFRWVNGQNRRIRSLYLKGSEYMEEYLKLIGEASKDAWTLFKTHTDAFNQPEKWWNELIEEEEKVIRKYKGTEAELYIWHYINFVIIPEIERMSRADKKGEKLYAVTKESFNRIMGKKKT